MRKIIAALVVAAVTVLVIPASASAHSRSFAQRCVDQHATPHSRIAHRCEARNWVIDRDYVMAPNGRLWTAESGWNARRPVDFDETLPKTSGPYWFNDGIPCKWTENPYISDDDDLPFCPMPE